MAQRQRKKAGGISATMRLIERAPSPREPRGRQRELLADFCRFLGGEAGNASAPPSSAGDHLPPRLRQTLARLLCGDSEKQIAARLGLSHHTIHVYVKALHKRFNVCSRGELLAKFVQRPPTDV